MDMNKITVEQIEDAIREYLSQYCYWNMQDWQIRLLSAGIAKILTTNTDPWVWWGERYVPCPICGTHVCKSGICPRCNTEPEDGIVKCGDCGLPYKKFALDFTLPDYQWKMIAQTTNILCANCIIERASRLPKVIALRGKIEFADEEQEYVQGRGVGFPAEPGDERVPDYDKVIECPNCGYGWTVESDRDITLRKIGKFYSDKDYHKGHREASLGRDGLEIFSDWLQQEDK